MTQRQSFAAWIRGNYYGALAAETEYAISRSTCSGRQNRWRDVFTARCYS